MTTIAYKDGVIATDGRILQGLSISDDNAVKRTVRKGVEFFFSGSVHDEPLLIDCYFNGPPESTDNTESNALIVDSGNIFEAAVNPDGYWCAPERRNNVVAIGSGASHAMTAMDLGCSAKEAVKMAAKRDAGTGGRVRTYKV